MNKEMNFYKIKIKKVINFKCLVYKFFFKNEKNKKLNSTTT